MKISTPAPSGTRPMLKFLMEFLEEFAIRNVNSDVSTKFEKFLKAIQSFRFVVDIMKKREFYGSEIAEQLNIPVSTAYNYLKDLNKMGILSKTTKFSEPGKRGPPRIIYKLNPDALSKNRLKVKEENMEIIKKLIDELGLEVLEELIRYFFQVIENILGSHIEELLHSDRFNADEKRNIREKLKPIIKARIETFEGILEILEEV
ncbi:HTH domain-containing protein [Candidatus Bathyarchaeota archaeon]|nr:HTH domain-containing protein [Candidatus Bathyarchaeota archaeon]